MAVIQHPNRFRGFGSVEVVETSSAGVSVNVRKSDSESVLTLFLGWSEVSRLMRVRRAARHRS